jgi:hypothetical protein
LRDGKMSLLDKLNIETWFAKIHMNLVMDSILQLNNKEEFKLHQVEEVQLIEWDISRKMNRTHYQGLTQVMDLVAIVKEDQDIKLCRKPTGDQILKDQ